MRLLVIEDDPMIAKTLSEFFRNNHYAVDVAKDGETGLRLVINTNYDLIMTDYFLPKMNGQELVNDLRANGNKTPIIVISSCETIENKLNLFQYGADDYMTKPFSSIELHARVKALLRRPQKINDEIFSCSDLELNLSNHEATRAGRHIYLTTKEFSILKLLIERPGTIYSRQIITEKVWDDASNHLSNIIEAHILHLRKKIDFKKPFLIQTVSGCGYKLNINH